MNKFLRTYASFLVVLFALEAGANNLKTKVVEIPPGVKEVSVEVLISPFVGVTLQYPEKWVSRFCGACTFGESTEGETRGLFRAVEKLSANQIGIAVSKKPGSQGAPPSSAYLTSFNVTLESGVSITTIIRIARPEDSIARVVFKLPKGQRATAMLDREREKMKAEFAEKTRKAIDEGKLKMLIGGVQCRTYWGAPKRHKGLVLRVNQICKSRDAVWALFEAENRSRATNVQLKEAILSGNTAIESALFHFDSSTLAFNERTKGVALVEVERDRTLPARWTLSIAEEGGKDRFVKAKDLTF